MLGRNWRRNTELGWFFEEIHEQADQDDKEDEGLEDVGGDHIFSSEGHKQKAR